MNYAHYLVNVAMSVVIIWLGHSLYRREQSQQDNNVTDESLKTLQKRLVISRTLVLSLISYFSCQLLLECVAVHIYVPEMSSLN